LEAAVALREGQRDAPARGDVAERRVRLHELALVDGHVEQARQLRHALRLRHAAAVREQQERDALVEQQAQRFRCWRERRGAVHQDAIDAVMVVVVVVSRCGWPWGKLRVTYSKA